MVYSHVEVRICCWFPASRPSTSRTCTFSHCVVVWRIVQYLFYLLYHVIWWLHPYATPSPYLFSSRPSPLIPNTALWCLLYLSGFEGHWPLHGWMDEIFQEAYRKIPKISPEAYIFQRPFFEGFIFGGAYVGRGLSMEGNLSFKIDWASLIDGSKFTVFALFYFVFEGNFPSTSSRGAYIWRGLFSEFYSIFKCSIQFLFLMWM